MRKRRSEALKAIAAKGRECAPDVLLVGSPFVGRIGLLVRRACLSASALPSDRAWAGPRVPSIRPETLVYNSLLMTRENPL